MRAPLWRMETGGSCGATSVTLLQELKYMQITYWAQQSEGNPAFKAWMIYEEKQGLYSQNGPEAEFLPNPLGALLIKRSKLGKRPGEGGGLQVSEKAAHGEWL